MNQWARSFAVSPDDVEYLQGLLLEREIPLSLEEIARLLIEKRIQDQQAALEEQYRGVMTYRPADSFAVGQRVLFPKLNFALANVTEVRDGVNPDLGSFKVIQVQFEDDTQREFAAELQTHRLNDTAAELTPAGGVYSVDAILEANRDDIYQTISDALSESDDLVRLAGKWFSRSLMTEVNEGHLHLAEAILDINSGGPMTTVDILENIGGLGEGSVALQEFCLNDALNNDQRFDEVGPLDTILWYLRRLEPTEVQQTPEILRYTPAAYDETSLTPEQQALETEIDDEWSLLDDQDMDPSERVRLILIYPHRRAGTLPLTSRMRGIFPTARSSARIALTLVDGQDNEEFSGWVVRQGRYVYGLADLYKKYSLPVGAHVSVRREPNSDKVVVDFAAHRPRTEWVRLIANKNGQLAFEDQKRPIGAEYDDLMILGTDDLAFVDGLSQANQPGRRTLAAILRNLLTELSRSTPQGAVHAKTLYSALNVLRRCPPGPMFATLNSDPDFFYVGNHYWRLGGS